MTLDFDEALSLAIEIRDEKRYLGIDYDWRSDVIALVESNAFTTAQAADIAGRNRQYVVKAVRDHFTKDLPEDYRPRTFGGVAGRLNVDSLDEIQYLRSRWTTMHRPGHRVDESTRRLILSLLEQGNGVSVLAHLTGISRNTIEVIRKTEARRAANG